MSNPNPVVNPLQPPPMQTAQQAHAAHSAHDSVGPVVGVLAVIAILGAVAVMIGRLCSGRGIRGYGKYDFEGWVESKCGSCIDGRADPPPPRVVVEHRAPPPEEGNNNQNHPRQG